MIKPFTGKHPLVREFAEVLGLPADQLHSFVLGFSADEVASVEARIFIDEAQMERMLGIAKRYRLAAEEELADAKHEECTDEDHAPPLFPPSLCIQYDPGEVLLDSDGHAVGVEQVRRPFSPEDREQCSLLRRHHMRWLRSQGEDPGEIRRRVAAIVRSGFGGQPDLDEILADFQQEADEVLGPQGGV